MQLNILNNKKVILILMNYKLDNKLNKLKMNKKKYIINYHDFY